MHNSTVILLVNFFTLNHFCITEYKATQYFLYGNDEKIEEQEAVGYLTKIQASEVLPLVQMLNKYKMELSPPQRLDKVFIHTPPGIMITGTQFTSTSGTIQLLFCPKEKSQQKCLVAKEFKRLQELACKKEPEPVVRKASGDISCGAGNIGKSHTVRYEICSRGPQLTDFKPKEILLYGLCIDLNNQKTIFTSHTIGYPELLDAKALHNEHNIKYKMEPTDGLNPSNIQELEAALDQEETNLSITDEDDDPEKPVSKTRKLTHFQDPESRAWEESRYQSYTLLPQDVDEIPKKHDYKLQKLTPPEDLAFASSRKSTYRFFNAELQHETLVPFWDEMNENIRIHSKKMYSKGWFRFSINTGVFDLTSMPREDGQKSNVWAKLIFASVSINDPMYGMVILMNNFIDKIVGSSEPRENSILDYCKDDHCEDTLKQKFEKVGGSVRCCSMNDDFKALFRWQEITTDSLKLKNTRVQLLRIPGINGLVEGESSKVV